jgi:hypothetical protein
MAYVWQANLPGAGGDCGYKMCREAELPDGRTLEHKVDLPGLKSPDGNHKPQGYVCPLDQFNFVASLSSSWKKNARPKHLRHLPQRLHQRPPQSPARALTCPASAAPPALPAHLHGLFVDVAEVKKL